MSPPPPPHRLLLALLAVLLLLSPPLLLASSSFPLPTIAIAATTNSSSPTTQKHLLACALVASGAAYRVSCASVSNRSAAPHVYSYGSGDGTSSPFSAVVAGDGYLCSAGPTSSPPMSMRWWDLNEGHDESKRVYRGEVLSAVSGGGESVCGLVGETMQCWRCPWGQVPDRRVGFSAVAVGGGFVCGLVVRSGEVRCYGGGEAVGRVPMGRYMLLAAGERHACAVDYGGVVGCWGDAAAVAAAAPVRMSRAVSTVAVGDAITCVLWGNWTVSCWPEGEASPPPALAQKQFVALEAKGKVVCGVLMSDYSLQCWGGGVAGGARKVFDRVLPGPCAPSKSCSCGVWSGSAELCGGGSDVSVCYPCGYTPPQMALAPASNSSSTSQSKGKHRPSNLVIALISAGAGSGLVALLAAVVVVYYLRRHRGSSSPVSGRIHAEPTGPAVPRVERRLSALLSKGPNTTVEQFPLAALRAATEFFSPAQRIGSGSFGAVYRASLPDGREVAIKRAERRDTGGPSSSSAAAARRIDHEAAFVSELALLSRVNHKNLVRLLGFCADGGERILVYEFMPNGTLHDHLHKRSTPLSPPLASWPARLRLALGAARGIEYMHTYAVPPIIHRDIKSSNILLDACWTAKVSDFGLSLLNNLDDAGGGNAGAGDDDPCVTAGTVGYMDPEYYRLQHLTDKSDVYSFGVVLLELLSGCKAIQKYDGSGSPKNVVDIAVPHIECDRLHRVLDARLPLPTPWEMEAVAYVGYLAADCVRLAGRDRPTMSEVVGVLERAVAACDEYEDGGGGGGGEPALSRSCTDGSTAT
ncbi:serine/threonine-protein kinase-like protein CCR4 [Oryza brachyantha]|uniref:serine/threonine-protein kinase-like protein CCR4 n=1 Tax=Oryza brachyantha TaxID=4533 RepID=UPI001AD96613|nr:serine/threonine-protein kinase-like protein CCR4 [Oryza brachyantha]